MLFADIDLRQTCLKKSWLTEPAGACATFPCWKTAAINRLWIHSFELAVLLESP